MLCKGCHPLATAPAYVYCRLPVICRTDDRLESPVRRLSDERKWFYRMVTKERLHSRPVIWLTDAVFFDAFGAPTDWFATNKDGIPVEVSKSHLTIPRILNRFTRHGVSAVPAAAFVLHKDCWCAMAVFATVQPDKEISRLLTVAELYFIMGDGYTQSSATLKCLFMLPRCSPTFVNPKQVKMKTLASSTTRKTTGGTLLLQKEAAEETNAQEEMVLEYGCFASKLLLLDDKNIGRYNESSSNLLGTTTTTALRRDDDVKLSANNHAKILGGSDVLYYVDKPNFVPLPRVFRAISRQVATTASLTMEKSSVQVQRVLQWRVPTQPPLPRTKFSSTSPRLLQRSLPWLGLYLPPAGLPVSTGKQFTQVVPEDTSLKWLKSSAVSSSSPTSFYGACRNPAVEKVIEDRVKEIIVYLSRTAGVRIDCIHLDFVIADVPYDIDRLHSPTHALAIKNSDNSNSSPQALLLVGISGVVLTRLKTSTSSLSLSGGGGASEILKRISSTDDDECGGRYETAMQVGDDKNHVDLDIAKKIKYATPKMILLGKRTFPCEGDFCHQKLTLPLERPVFLRQDSVATRWRKIEKSAASAEAPLAVADDTTAHLVNPASIITSRLERGEALEPGSTKRFLSRQSAKVCGRCFLMYGKMERSRSQTASTVSSASMATTATTTEGLTRVDIAQLVLAQFCEKSRAASTNNVGRRRKVVNHQRPHCSRRRLTDKGQNKWPYQTCVQQIDNKSRVGTFGSAIWLEDKNLAMRTTTNNRGSRSYDDMDESDGDEVSFLLQPDQEEGFFLDESLLGAAGRSHTSLSVLPKKQSHAVETATVDALLDMESKQKKRTRRILINFLTQLSERLNGSNLLWLKAELAILQEALHAATESTACGKGHSPERSKWDLHTRRLSRLRPVVILDRVLKEQLRIVRLIYEELHRNDCYPSRSDDTIDSTPSLSRISESSEIYSRLCIIAATIRKNQDDPLAYSRQQQQRRVRDHSTSPVSSNGGKDTSSNAPSKCKIDDLIRTALEVEDYSVLYKKQEATTTFRSSQFLLPIYNERIAQTVDQLIRSVPSVQTLSRQINSLKVQLRTYHSLSSACVHANKRNHSPS